ncbi:MAG: SPFH domain-containing protein, partial [Anaerolineae bacterium]|nr:SPFH domain-containing protein [Anaerolineae bacterium]
TFGPGRHTISTANIPLLTGLISIPFSGETPFKAEVYFVNLREFLEQKWGTPEAITLRDSELGMVRLRAFGTYSMQVSEPQLFVNKVVGTQGLYQTSQIQGFLRGIIIAKLTDLLGELQKSLLDLPSMYDEIGAGAKAKVQDDFNALGIALKTLYVTSISPTEETAKAIDERASMGAIGNMQAYLQFKTARVMTEAAGAPGGVAGVGVGLGAGVGMGAAMAQMMTQAMQPGAQAAATMICPSCSAQIPAGSKFCPQCGGKIGGEMICPNCKADVPDGSKFCPNCGTKIA